MGRRRLGPACLSAVPASLLFPLSVVFTFLNAHVFLGEALTPDMIVGAALIVLGVILSRARSGDKDASA